MNKAKQKKNYAGNYDWLHFCDAFIAHSECFMACYNMLFVLTYPMLIHNLACQSTTFSVPCQSIIGGGLAVISVILTSRWGGKWL